MANWQAVLNFWTNAGPEKWFSKDDAFDAALTEKFLQLNEEASQGKHDSWRDEAGSCLALILVLDQFSRNMFRNSAKAFSRDKKGVELARHALTMGLDLKMPKEISFFCYLPFMHSESILDQKTCLKLMHIHSAQGGLSSARTHLEIIERFGRFPHRNDVLGRHTTPAEQAFLDDGGFSG